MAFFIDQDIFRFQIPVNDVIRMQMFNSKDQFWDVKSGISFWKLPFLLNLGEQVDSWTIFKNKIYKGRSLKTMVKVYDKWVIKFFQYKSFLKYIVDFISQNQIFFILSFHGVNLVLIPFSYNEDLSESAVSNFS